MLASIINITVKPQMEKNLANVKMTVPAKQVESCFPNDRVDAYYKHLCHIAAFYRDFPVNRFSVRYLTVQSGADI